MVAAGARSQCSFTWPPRALGTQLPLGGSGGQRGARRDTSPRPRAFKPGDFLGRLSSAALSNPDRRSGVALRSLVRDGAPALEPGGGGSAALRVRARPQAPQRRGRGVGTRPGDGESEYLDLRPAGDDRHAVRLPGGGDAARGPALHAAAVVGCRGVGRGGVRRRGADAQQRRAPAACPRPGVPLGTAQPATAGGGRGAMPWSARRVRSPSWFRSGCFACTSSARHSTTGATRTSGGSCTPTATGRSWNEPLTPA